MSTVSTKMASRVGEPAWEVARLFPDQGYWTEEDYLDLTNTTNCLVEFSDGFIEVLPAPTTSHHMILAFLYRALLAFIESQKLGTVLFAGIRVRLRKGKYCEPDIVFMLAEHADRIGEKYWQGADLVIEVVSGDEKDRERDIVDPENWTTD